MTGIAQGEGWDGKVWVGNGVMLVEAVVVQKESARGHLAETAGAMGVDVDVASLTKPAAWEGGKGGRGRVRGRLAAGWFVGTRS